jgi:CBS domain containing-hemolysin-like protein
VGALDASFRGPFRGAFELETRRISDLVKAGATPTAVPHDATAADVQAAAEQSGHLRILVDDEHLGVVGVVHVRDTLLEEPARPALELAREPFILEAGTVVHEALTRMRQASEQLAVVVDGDRVIGVVTHDDVLRNVLPRRDDAVGLSAGD